MVHAATSERFSSVFASFDRDADGRISAAELRLCMKAALREDVSAEDAEALVALADTDGDRLLDEQEFLRLVARPETEAEEERQGSGWRWWWRRHGCEARARATGRHGSMRTRCRCGMREQGRGGRSVGILSLVRCVCSWRRHRNEGGDRLRVSVPKI